MKFVFLDQEPLTPRRRKVFELDALLEKENEIEFWDLSAYCFDNIIIKDTIIADFVIHINTIYAYKKEVEKQDLKNTLFIFEGYLATLKPELNNILKRLQATTIRFEINTTSKLPKRTVVDKVKRLTQYHLFEIFKQMIKVGERRMRTLCDKSYSAIISTGSIIPADIYVNHSDYILFLESQTNSPLINEPYIVFLDQFYPYHPDFKSKGLNIEHNAKSFFYDLNRYFDKIEEQYEMEIVIAAHPKANYDPAIFNNRRVFYGESVALVKDAQAVIAISSASIDFVVMNSKPLALVITNDILNCPQIKNELVDYQRSLANILNINILNISNINDTDDLSIRTFSSEARQDYLYLYMTSPGIENKLNAELLPFLLNSLIN